MGCTCCTLVHLHLLFYVFTGIRGLFRSGGIKHELKKIMFSGDAPIILSGDDVIFCMVMSIFHNYERQVSHDAY